MEATENFTKTRTVRRLPVFPRHHTVAAGVLGAALIISTFLPPSDSVEVKRHTQTIELKIDADLEPLLPDVDQPSTEYIVPTVDWHRERVVSGDNLSLIFQRAGLNDRKLFEFMAGNPNSKNLKRIHPGHELEFHIEEGRLMGLRYRQDQLQSQVFTRTGDSVFEYQEEFRQPDIELAYRTAVINDSLFLAGQRAQMDADMIMELANIFGWDIDFGLDIRRGDQFKVLYEERFLDGEKIGNGNILAAEFTNQKSTFGAVRYEDSNGAAHYYTPDGKSMRKAFLRAPLDFRRISSNFNPRRLHPIFKTARPHRGTDYAAATGTPVWSSGDGKVIASSYSSANGNFVVIQHGNNIQTKYLHLHKRYVKIGQRIKQKQPIGTVGSTGYATGPHLHYEFLLDGVHRNPRTIVDKLPKAKSIADSEMSRFMASTQPLLANLESFHQQKLLTRLEKE